jgi:Na+-translocating ferredoxin:NAD+ oxidoreductase RnfD subunit
VKNRTVSLRGREYPLILPSIRDPRLHVAAVILSVHALGQLGLHFQVSVPQILAAILTCAIIEVAVTFVQHQAFVWPASAMLTGSGVALILRVVGTPADNPWNTYDWYVFAWVAAASLLTKYVIRYQGANLFNPSNVGLVVVFVALGSRSVEPLDFWWAPLNVWMIAAYIVIIGGGSLITRRLHLLALAATFWLALSVGIGILAASGHCITANWAFAPVCGADYWRVVVASPEVLIFLFFMITDPRIVPAGRVARVVFGALTAAACTLLMAPQTDEFGTKVGLLAGLTVLCVGRPVLDRLMPEPRSAADSLIGFAARLVTGGAGAGILRGAARVALVVVAISVVGVGVVFAGTPARGLVVPDSSEALNQLPHQINPETLPPITVSQSVWNWDHEIAGSAPQLLVLLAQNLEIENQALLRSDASLLTAVDHGDRLKEMQARLHGDATAGTTVIDLYAFDSVNVTLLVPFGVQTGLSLGFDSRGTVTEETYDSAGRLVSRRSSPFADTFAIRRATGARWLNVAVLPPGSGT